MKKSATDIIDQYTDNGTLQHGQSQFLGTATKLGNFTWDAETPYGRVVSPEFVKVTGVLNGVTTVTANPVVNEEIRYYPAKIIVNRENEYYNENAYGGMKIEITDEVNQIIVVYENESPSVMNIILFSTREKHEYPFTQVLANKGVVWGGDGQFGLDYYSDQKPIEISLEDYEGFLGWAILDQQTGMPSSQMLSEQQIFVLDNATEQIVSESGVLFAMIDKKINPAKN